MAVYTLVVEPLESQKFTPTHQFINDLVPTIFYMVLQKRISANWCFFVPKISTPKRWLPEFITSSYVWSDQRNIGK